jgi:hypothetical protein
MNCNYNIKRDVNHIWWILRLTYSAGYLLAGADKFLHLVEDWTKLITHATLLIFHIDLTRLLYIIGSIELAIGILLLTRYVKLGAYLAMIWLLIKSAYIFHTGHFFEIAIRYFVVAMGALALAYLTNIRSYFYTCIHPDSK